MPIVPLRLLAIAAAAVALAATSAGAGGGNEGFGGTIGYTGKLGPVSSRRPLCLCVYQDAGLRVSLGCLIYSRNNSSYQIELGRTDYHLIGFLDIHVNERLDPDEAYEIYNDRKAPPADPVAGTSGRNDIDLIFGDENTGGIPTPTATITPTASPTSTPATTPTSSPTSTPSSTPTFSPTAPAPTSTPLCVVEPIIECGDECVGDCDGNGAVEVTELILLVRGALGAGTSACAAGDANGDGTFQVDELVEAVRLNLTACQP
jgi:hypothetical protein